MTSKAAAARMAAAVAARRAASDIRRFAPARSPRRGFFGGDAAGWTRPVLSLAAPGPRILRRGLAMIPGEPSPGPEEFTPDMFDPYADNPECFDYDEKDLESEETMWALYERWRGFYNVKRDHDDVVSRFVHFKDRARRIHEFNKLGKPWSWGLQIYGDLTPEEFDRLKRRQLLRRPNEEY
ncbi:unnamed protein product [Urochloa decumbens]|uniref:Cathepsin propeptide inhibitor domain-containing protein n=1 Tax=Urochloa decumbens TaxID=240449 RepID=A0ABC9GGB9_9POAL